MVIKQVKVTAKTLIKQLGDGNVYLVRDKRNHSNKLKNSGRLTLSQLKFADVEDILQRIEDGEEIIAIQVFED